MEAAVTYQGGRNVAEVLCFEASPECKAARWQCKSCCEDEHLHQSAEQTKSRQKTTFASSSPLMCLSAPCVLTEAIKNVHLCQMHHDMKCILGIPNWRKPLHLWKYVMWLQSLKNEYSDTCNAIWYNQRYCCIDLNHFLLLKIHFLFRSLILNET